MIIRFLVLMVLLLESCTPVYVLQNKDRVKNNDDKLSELTALVNNNNYSAFLNNLKINNHLIVSGVDSLGFGFFMQRDCRCLNDEICFYTNVLKHEDSIVSVSMSPIDFRIKPIIQGHYRRILGKLGWKSAGYYFGFKEKICSSQTLPVLIPDDSFTYRPKFNATIDSLMSAHLQVSLSSIKGDISENDLLYLMHSANRWTRIQAIRYIKCNGIQVGDKTSKWVNYITENSPHLPAMYTEHIIGTEPVNYFLDCNSEKHLFLH